MHFIAQKISYPRNVLGFKVHVIQVVTVSIGSMLQYRAALNIANLNKQIYNNF